MGKNCENKCLVGALPSIGESDPSLLKLNPPRNPGGVNCGWLSGLGGNWRPRRRARISGNWGRCASMGGIPGNPFPPLFRKFGKFPEPGNGKGGLAVRRARSAALAAMLSLRGRGLGRSWDILWSIIVFSGPWSRGWGGSALLSLRSSPGYLGGNPRAPGRKIVVAVLKLKNADFNALWHSGLVSALLAGYYCF